MPDDKTVHATATDARDDHASGHGHEPPPAPLGPIDVTGWAYAVGGGAIGLVVALAFFVAGGG